jgi:hypothetical protein
MIKVVWFIMYVLRANNINSCNNDIDYENNADDINHMILDGQFCSMKIRSNLEKQVDVRSKQSILEYIQYGIYFIFQKR